VSERLKVILRFTQVNATCSHLIFIHNRGMHNEPKGSCSTHKNYHAYQTNNQNSKFVTTFINNMNRNE